jgi:hypothetical protein
MAGMVAKSQGVICVSFGRSSSKANSSLGSRNTDHETQDRVARVGAFYCAPCHLSFSDQSSFSLGRV